MDKIVLTLSEDTVLEVNQIDKGWFRFHLYTPWRSISVGCEGLNDFQERVKRFLGEFKIHEIQDIKWISSFSEPHSAIYAKKLSATKILLLFQDKDNVFVWEEEVSIEVIKHWLSQINLSKLEL